MPDVVVVVPTAKGLSDRMLRQGWKAGRCTAHTVTLYKQFTDPDTAEITARALPNGLIWTIEGMRRG